MNNKLILFIANKKGLDVLKTVMDYSENLIGCIVTFYEVDVKENYYYEIKEICKNKNYPFYEWKDIKDNLINIIEFNKIGTAVAIGWRYIIPLYINKYLKNDLIVFHDSLLPKYRGFCPTPTAIICGEKEIGTTVLFATDKVDAGDIIIQKKVKIDDNLYIKDIIDKQSCLYCQCIKELIDMIKRGNITGVPQDNAKASYSIWRNPEDCKINWDNDATEIYNLIRATSFPYTGAFTYVEKNIVYIWKSQIEKEDLSFVIRHPGKIWTLDNNNPVVICGKGLIKLTDIRDKNGNKIVLNKIRIKLG